MVTIGSFSQWTGIEDGSFAGTTLPSNFIVSNVQLASAIAIKTMEKHRVIENVFANTKRQKNGGLIPFHFYI